MSEPVSVAFQCLFGVHRTYVRLSLSNEPGNRVSSQWLASHVTLPVSKFTPNFGTLVLPCKAPMRHAS